MAEEQEMNEQQQEDGLRDFSALQARPRELLHLKTSVCLKTSRFSFPLRLAIQKSK